MAVEIKVPSAGESVTEGILGRWLKKDGDYVKLDEPVVELETDKATQAVPAPAAGVLRIGVPEGQTVLVGAVIGRVEEGAAAPDAAPAPAKPAPAAKPAAGPTLSPAARAMAEERRIDPAKLTGSGRGGVVLKEDVANYAAPPAPPPVPAPQPAVAVAVATNGTAPRETRQRMSQLRATIARRLVESQQTTASLTTFNEADMTAIMELRAKYKDGFAKKHGVALGFMSFFVRAVCEAARAFPAVNGRIEGNDIVTHHYVNVGVAVSTEKGLMVPVLRDADRMSFAQIEKEIGALATRAREGRITVTDLQGGTFTITNGGVFGSLLSTPILNPPQSAILGMHAIQKRPVAVGDEVKIRPMMYLALSYDHRLIDGREAVQFLVRVKECVESPERLLLEV
jgi:2-oxoglutarate dehydrogenase E2 component (dihydrolipoamide succinyltransferase)